MDESQRSTSRKHDPLRRREGESIGVIPNGESLLHFLEEGKEEWKLRISDAEL